MRRTCLGRYLLDGQSRVSLSAIVGVSEHTDGRSAVYTDISTGISLRDSP